MATNPRSQIPSKFEFLGRDQKITQPWQFWLQGLENGLAPTGTGYVIDNTAGTTGSTSVSQGVSTNRGGVPKVNEVYIADDNGAVYTVSGGRWQVQTPAYTGDVLKSAFSTVTSLADVNNAPGTYGSGTVVPIITVDAKGRVIHTAFAPIQPAPLPGSIGSFVYIANSAGAPGSDTLYSKDTFTVTHRIEFHQGDATPVLIFGMPSNTVVSKVELTVLTAFDGTSPTIAVGTNGIYNDIMDTTDNNPTVLSNWTVEPGIKYVTPQNVYVSISAGGGSTGYALIVISTVQL